MEVEANKKAILLVEDNPDDELLTLRALKKQNIQNEVVVTRDGQEAVDYLFAQGTFSNRNIDDLPQLILLDLKLPKLNGIDVLRMVRNHPKTKLIPIVVLTTSTEEKDVVESYHFGANSYIRKPVDFIEFAQAVNTLGMYWLLLNQSAQGRVSERDKKAS